MTAAADTLSNLPDPVRHIAIAAVTAALAGEGELLAAVLNDTDDDELRSTGPRSDHARGQARWLPGLSPGASYRVTHIDHTIAEASMVQEFEVESNATGQRRLATANEHGA